MNDDTQPHLHRAASDSAVALHQKLSRRQLLLMMGLGCGFVGTICGSSSVALYHLLVAENKDEAGALIQENQEPTVSPTENPIARPRIVSRAEWGAAPVNLEAENENGLYDPESNAEGWRVYDDDLALIYKTVIIHHSVLYDRDDLNTMRAIQALHMEDRGWADVGYHFCVGKDGTIFEGRQMMVRGTHTEAFNTGSLGICLMGNFEEEVPSLPQLTATQQLVVWLVGELALTHLAGHFEFNPASLCPGANLYAWLDEMALMAGLQRGTDGYVAPIEQQQDTGDQAAAFCCCCSA